MSPVSRSEKGANENETILTDTTILSGPFVNSLTNPDGSPRGGMSVHAKVADTAHVASSATILAGAIIDEECEVKGRSIVGPGVTIRGNATVQDSKVTPVTKDSPGARVDISGFALIEQFQIRGISVQIFGDAWICPRFESDIRNGKGKLVSYSGGYSKHELLDNGKYGGSSKGTTRADILSQQGVAALRNWLLSEPLSVRRRHPEEMAAVASRTGKPIRQLTVVAPVYRLVNTFGGRYVVPMLPADFQRVEDLMKSGASFPEIASMYDMHQDTLFAGLEQHIGFNPFSSWEKFVGRPAQAQYTLLTSVPSGFISEKWVAADPEDHQAWEKEKRNVEGGLLHEFDQILPVRHASILDRPEKIVWIESEES